MILKRRISICTFSSSDCINDIRKKDEYVEPGRIQPIQTVLINLEKRIRKVRTVSVFLNNVDNYIINNKRASITIDQKKKIWDY